jgi:hypothetical protein
VHRSFLFKGRGAHTQLRAVAPPAGEGGRASPWCLHIRIR